MVKKNSGKGKASWNNFPIPPGPEVPGILDIIKKFISVFSILKRNKKNK